MSAKGAAPLSVTSWTGHFGFSATPFGKSIPAAELFARAAHQEAVARIRACIAERALAVIIEEVGAGKTVALREWAHVTEVPW